MRQLGNTLRSGERLRALPGLGYQLVGVLLFYGLLQECVQAGIKRLSGDVAQALTSDEFKVLKKF